MFVNGKWPITQPIVPAEQEFVNINTLWCYLFHKLVGDDGETGKCLSTFATDVQKGQTIAALLDKTFFGILSTDNKPTPYITTETVTYIFALVINSVPIYHTDSPHSCALQHEALVFEALDDLPADEFRAELLASLTDFYEKILKKVGAGGRAANKPLQRKFEPKIAPVPVPEDACYCRCRRTTTRACASTPPRGGSHSGCP